MSRRDLLAPSRRDRARLWVRRQGLGRLLLALLLLACLGTALWLTAA